MKANFFGYVVSKGQYKLSDDRKFSVTSIPFPKTGKQILSFLGCALFFNSFMENYSGLTFMFHEKAKKDFN